MAVFPTRALEVEFDAGVWTDITAYVTSISSRRGRNRESGAFETGRLIVNVQNSDRRFDPDHATGPYYGKLRPNRRVRWRETYSAVTYPVFVGYIDRIAQVYGGPNDATAVIEVSDFFKILNRAELPQSVYIAEVAADTPAAWWWLNPPAGSTVARDSAGIFDLGVTGSPVFGDPGLVVRDPNSAMTGGDAAGATRTGAFPATGAPLTLEVWYRHVVGQPGGRIIGLYSRGPAGLDTLAFLQTSGTNLAFTVYRGASTGDVTSTGVDIKDGAVHHLVGVWEAGGALKVYIDGTDRTSGSATVTAGVFPALTGTTFVAGDADVGALGFGGSTGAYQYAAIYAAALSTTRIAAHNSAGRTPWNGDLPGPRLTRIFDLAAVPAADRTIGAGDTPLQSTDLGGTALAYAQKVEETDLGWLFVARDGKVTYIGRQAGQTGAYLTSKGTLVDADSGAGLPYRATDAAADEAFIVTRSTASRDGSVAVQVYDAAAKAEFGWIDETHDGLLHDSDTYSKDYAEWILNTHKTPGTRIGQIDLELTGDPANLYPFVLGLELADHVVYKRKPQNTGAVTTIDMRVESIGHETAGGYWRTRLQLSPFNLGEGGYPVFVWGTTKWGQHVWGI